MEIVAVDPSRAELFEEWHAVMSAADRLGREELASTWQLEEVRVAHSRVSRQFRRRAFAGLVDGRVVAATELDLPELDNRWRADVSVYVAPGQRRRGHGSAMLEHLEALVRAEGRTTLLAEVAWPYAEGPDGSGPGVAFARAHGFELALADVQRRLRLPVADEVLDRLAADAAGHHDGYTLRSWTGPVPDELLPQWAALEGSLDTEAPMGDLELEPQALDAAAVREAEELKELQGRTSLHSVALRSDGRLAAYTELVVPVHEPGKAYQWGTLVRREDRGHRLGVAIKVANLRLLQQTRPDVRCVFTYNAESNAHMIAVNEVLGFAPTERLGEFQKKLGA